MRRTAKRAVTNPLQVNLSFEHGLRKFLGEPPTQESYLVGRHIPLFTHLFFMPQVENQYQNTKTTSQHASLSPKPHFEGSLSSPSNGRNRGTRKVAGSFQHYIALHTGLCYLLRLRRRV